MSTWIRLAARAVNGRASPFSAAFAAQLAHLRPDGPGYGAEVPDQFIEAHEQDSRNVVERITTIIRFAAVAIAFVDRPARFADGARTGERPPG